MQSTNAGVAMLAIISMALPGLDCTAAETVLRGHCIDCNIGLHEEHFCYGSPLILNNQGGVEPGHPDRGVACAINAKQTFDVYTAQEVDGKIQAATQELIAKNLLLEKNLESISKTMDSLKARLEKVENK